VALLFGFSLGSKVHWENPRRVRIWLVPLESVGLSDAKYPAQQINKW